MHRFLKLVRQESEPTLKEYPHQIPSDDVFYNFKGCMIKNNESDGWTHDGSFKKEWGSFDLVCETADRLRIARTLAATKFVIKDDIKRLRSEANKRHKDFVGYAEELEEMLGYVDSFIPFDD